jgi:hypothetical protein
MVKKGFAGAIRTHLFSTPKFSFRDGQPVYLLNRIGMTLLRQTHSAQYIQKPTIRMEIVEERIGF